MMDEQQDTGASADADRAVVNGAGQAVSALRASVPGALFTHNHAGWRRHDLPGADEESLLATLHSTHGFLAEYEGQYRVEIRRTPERSYDGKVLLYWDSDTPKTFVFGVPLRRGDYWCTAFEFNAAPVDACRYCGGTGIDHYSALSHCWACDGTAKQIRQSTPRGFMKKPVAACAPATHARYAKWLAAQAMSTGTAKTPKAVEGRSPASAVPNGDAPHA
jgi:hypothetical protein